MTLQALSSSDDAVACEALLRCCGSTRWADAMLARRPFADRKILLDTANSLWWELSTNDWLEAFAAHPKIGEKKLAGWCCQEQNGVHSAPDAILEELAQGNAEYEQRFGWIFLVNATGKTAPQMLASLKARMENTSSDELRVAAAEQAQITALRLQKLLDA